MVASWSSAVPSRFWSGMYNRFEKGLQPRQSVTDYLMAVKEETQQLEEELEALGEVRHFPDHCCSMEACQDSGYVKCSNTDFRIFSQWITWNTAPPGPPGEHPENWSPNLSSTEYISDIWFEAHFHSAPNYSAVPTIGQDLLLLLFGSTNMNSFWRINY